MSGKQKILIFFKKGIDKPKKRAIIGVQTRKTEQPFTGGVDRTYSPKSQFAEPKDRSKKTARTAKDQICTGFWFRRILSEGRKTGQSRKASQVKNDADAEQSGAEAMCQVIEAGIKLRTFGRCKAKERIFVRYYQTGKRNSEFGWVSNRQRFGRVPKYFAASQTIARFERVNSLRTHATSRKKFTWNPCKHLRANIRSTGSCRIGRT